jgi:hypothetical protein
MRVARGAIDEIAGLALRQADRLSGLGLPAEIKPGRLDPGGWLPARTNLQTRFLMFYAKAPEGFTRIDDVVLEGAKLTVVDRFGATVGAACRAGTVDWKRCEPKPEGVGRCA